MVQIDKSKERNTFWIEKKNRKSDKEIQVKILRRENVPR